MHRQIALHHHVAGEDFGQGDLRGKNRARQQEQQKQSFWIHGGLTESELPKAFRGWDAAKESGKRTLSE